jgi:hypothetical protein
MAGNQEVIVAVSDLDQAGFSRVLQGLKRAGLQIQSSSFELGFVAGRATVADLAKIRKVPGVESAELGRQVQMIGVA